LSEDQFGKKATASDDLFQLSLFLSFWGSRLLEFKQVALIFLTKIQALLLVRNTEWTTHFLLKDWTSNFKTVGVEWLPSPSENFRVNFNR